MGIESVALSLLVSVVTAMVTAFVTNWRAYRKEVNLLRRKERKEVLDECLEFLDEFRVSPEIALEKEFYIRALHLGNHLRVYTDGLSIHDKSVYEEMRTFVLGCRKQYVQYVKNLDCLEQEQFSSETQYDDCSGTHFEVTHTKWQMEEYEQKRAEIKAANTPSAKEAKLVSDPVFEAIYKLLKK